MNINYEYMGSAPKSTRNLAEDFTNSPESQNCTTDDELADAWVVFSGQATDAESFSFWFYE